MTPKSLLKHIFRYIPQPRPSTPTDLRTHEVDPETTESLPPASTTAEIPPPMAISTDTPGQTKLEDIAEEPGDSLSTDTSSTTRDVSISEELTGLHLDLSGLTTDELLNAAIHEAKSALQSHRDSIATILALLTALDGFSPTITTLKEEMLIKEAACKERLQIMMDVEAMMASLDLDKAK